MIPTFVDKKVIFYLFKKSYFIDYRTQILDLKRFYLTWPNMSHVDPDMLVPVVSGDLEVESQHSHHHHGGVLPMLTTLEEFHATEDLEKEIGNIYYLPAVTYLC